MESPEPAASPRGDRDNNFTIIRWVAAFAVLVSHAFPLAVRHRSRDLLAIHTGHELGWYAVNAFFILSGFLVTKSLWSRKSLPDFLRARALRIFPGLAVMLVVVVSVLGFVFGTLPWQTFWKHELTWRHLVGNATLLGTHIDTLPGVFRGRVVNGSLWTLPGEVFCYILLAVAGLLGAAHSRARLWVSIAAAFIVYLVLVLAPNAVGFYPSILPSRDPDIFPRLGFCFLLGVVYFQIRDRLALKWWAVPLVWTLPLLAAGTPLRSAAIAIALAYTVFWFGFLRIDRLRPLQRMPDYSYGIYIYAFPVQRCVYQLRPGMSPLANIVVAGAATILLAAASWHLVEKPALGLVRRFRETPFRSEGKPRR